MSEQVINFTRGVPAEESFPLERVAECASAAITGRYGTTVMQYGKSYGFPPLREWLAEKHGVGVENVMLANGSLQLLDFMGLALLSSGDTVFVESPTYDRTLTLLRRHQANIVGIALGSDGPNLEALESALQEHQPEFFYTIADFQNPSGVTMSLEKREYIAELAQRHGFWIVEDAPYRPLRYRGKQLPALSDLAPDTTLQMSSFTKQISPGVRTGYLVGNAKVLKKLAKAAEDTYITPNLIGEATVWEFCRRGWLDEQLDALRELYRPRLVAVCDAIRDELPDADWIEPDGGFFVSVTLPEGLTNTQLRAAAADRKLNLSNGTGFFPIPSEGERFLRLPFCALTPDELRSGVRRLAEVVDDVS